MKRRRTADDFMRDMAAKRLAEPFCRIVDSLWTDERVNGDTLAAVKRLRDLTGIGLIDALEAIKASAKRLGKPCDLKIVRGRDFHGHGYVGVADDDLRLLGPKRRPVTIDSAVSTHQAQINE